MGQLLPRFCVKGGRERRRGQTFDPDEKWSNLYREREKNNIYKWVGVRNGGDLITVYEKDGEEGVLNFAREKLETMMFNEGRQPQLIKYSDYVRWKKSVNTVFGIIEEEDFNEANSKFREHEAQWRLNKRGVEGETMVHLLLNREEPLCTEIARILIHCYPGLAKDVYLGDEMFGQSCLHLAIVHDDYETVQLLLQNGALVNARASGNFFMPEEEYDNDSKQMDYQGYAYYGEYPLAFAACFENKDIYDLLIQYGANPDLQDIYGNTCLHMCVINGSNSMYSYAVRHWHKPAKTNVVNHAGYTPLTLATKLGRKQIFDEMLELMKVEFWRFSDMTCSAYPLDTLDTIRSDGSTNYDSALMTVINGTTTGHLDMIGSEVIQRLLADKWKAYAKRKLIERLVLLIFHLIFLCFVVYLRPTEKNRLFMQSGAKYDDWIRTVFEILSILSCCWFIFIQQLDELRTQGFYSYIRNLKTAPAKIVFVVANLCLLACVPCRFLQLYQIEEGLLVFAVPGSWIFLLFFARSAKLTGPFVQMIYSMIAGDMIRFAIISSIFLVSFSQVFYFVGKDMYKKQTLDKDNIEYCSVDGYRITTYSSYLETFVSLFRASMGGYDYEEFSCTNYEPLTKTLFVIYMFIMPIMMINILIAMMGNTYTTVITQAEKAWRQQYAQIVMVLERSINRQKLATSQLDYSIRLNDPGRETRGLMVIKQTKKTKARQRKQAINNWKQIGRKVIVMVNDFGYEHTMYLLHSHDLFIDTETMGGVPAVANAAVSRSNRSMSNIANFNTTGEIHFDHENNRREYEYQSTNELYVNEPFADHHGFMTKKEAFNSDPNIEMTISYQKNLNFSSLYKAVSGKYLGDLNLKQREITSSDEHVVESNLKIEDRENKAQSSPLVFSRHITQRTLIPIHGSRVRGVEMLPSIEIPNIPTSLSTTTNISTSKITPKFYLKQEDEQIDQRFRKKPLNEKQEELGDVVVVKATSALTKGASTDGLISSSASSSKSSQKRPQTVTSIGKTKKKIRK